MEIQSNIKNKKTVVSKISLIKSIKSLDARKYTMVIALLAIWGVFSLLTNGIFTSSRNLSNLFLQMCTIGILACGMVFIMVTGNIDISLGSAVGALGAFGAVLMVKFNVPPIWAILLTLLAGVLIGAWHGYWIAYRGVPAMIATLASMTALKGVTLGITGGVTVSGFSKGFKLLGQGYLPKLFFQDAKLNDTSLILTIIVIALFVLADIRKRKSYKRYGFKVLRTGMFILKEVSISLAIALVCYIMISYRGIPYAILILMAVAFILTFIGNKTPFGRSIYAIGGNQEAAKFSGITIKLNLMIMYCMMGLLSAIAALVFTARLNAATTSAGNMFEMDAIAAAVIGGTSPAGGVGTVMGAIIGALVMASLDNGMSLLNVNIMYQYIIKGLVLLLAVAIDAASRKKGGLKI
ncbi:MAG: sugar ABC transporter permease [Ruminiclostridium sp.]